MFLEPWYDVGEVEDSTINSTDRVLKRLEAECAIVKRKLLEAPTDKCLLSAR